ncbi:aminotransferase class IV [Candidatus Gracilibacteria bacterium]|nr:aminotransferase class IV [Candidatus Gracilibacteria bacterium]
MFICFDGNFLKPKENSLVSPFLNATMFGYSVFETLRTYDSTQIFCKETHLDRLFKSADILKLTLPIDRKELSKNLDILVEKNQQIKQDLRIKIFCCEDFYWIRTQLLDEIPTDFYTKGIEVCDQVFERSFPKAKYANPAYPFFLKIQPKHCFETIFFNETGFLREGNISNIFVVLDKKIVTSKQNILSGITREKVLETSRILNIKTEEREITREEVSSSDALFLTNTTKEIVPIRKWGNWEKQDFEIAHLLRKHFPKGNTDK